MLVDQTISSRPTFRSCESPGAKLIPSISFFRLVRLAAFASILETKWRHLVIKERELAFLLVVVAASLIALTGFSTGDSFSNYLIYGILLVVFVLANRERFRLVQTPTALELMLALAVVAGSFAFNYLTGLFTGDSHFGLTDYVILVTGFFFLFYSVGDALAQTGAALLVILRGATLALSAAYPLLFSSVSDFFVTIVLGLSNLLMSGEIHAGYEPGQVVVGGAAGYSVVEIGWACAGLEELVLIAVLLYVLIDSMHLDFRPRLAWLVLGIVGSFLINIVRMVILVWVAYSEGVEKMLWVHTHLGDVLFLLWIAVFWILFFRSNASSPSTDGREGGFSKTG